MLLGSHQIIRSPMLFLCFFATIASSGVGWAAEPTMVEMVYFKKTETEWNGGNYSTAVKQVSTWQQYLPQSQPTPYETKTYMQNGWGWWKLIDGGIDSNVFSTPMAGQEWTTIYNRGTVYEHVISGSCYAGIRIWNKGILKHSYQVILEGYELSPDGFVQRYANLRDTQLNRSVTIAAGKFADVWIYPQDMIEVGQTRVVETATYPN